MSRPNSDEKHLKKLRNYFAAHRVLPSLAGLGALLGFKGKSGASKLVQRLVDAGILERAPGSRLVPTDRFFELPLTDQQVPAGQGKDDNEFSSFERFSLDRLLVGDHARTVLVPVCGDSMIEAGVLDGDTAVVERSESARSGDFVIASIDGKYTIKELRFERRIPVLVPHNKDYETIRPREDFLILGVVRAIVRRYDKRGRSTKIGGARS